MRTIFVILNYNSSAESIGLFNNLKDINTNLFEILVIDNNSKKPEQDLLKTRLPLGNLIFNPSNTGYAGGNNIGIEYAIRKKAEFIWLLNPDIRINNKTFQILFTTISKDPRIAAIGPRITQREAPERIFSNGGIVDRNNNFKTTHRDSNSLSSQIPPIIDYEVDYIDGSCMLLRTEAIKDVGKIPEDYFLYFEETDWCLKAKSRNWKIVVDQFAEAANLNSDKNSRYYFYMARNKVIFNHKYNPNFKEARKVFVKELIEEVYFRIRGKYFKPFYLSRVKGVIYGLLKTAL